MIAKDSGQKNNFHIMPSFITLETRWNWAQLTFAKSFGTVTKEREKIGQQLTGMSPVTIPGTIARHISTPVPFLFLK